jgi:hypothetical protein
VMNEHGGLVGYEGGEEVAIVRRRRIGINDREEVLTLSGTIPTQANR